MWKYNKTVNKSTWWDSQKDAPKKYGNTFNEKMKKKEGRRGGGRDRGGAGESMDMDQGFAMIRYNTLTLH